MREQLVHYRSPDEDSSRWIDFPFRDDDIVISTRSKTGTTWVQMICALLIFQEPELPDKLSALSPWLDWLINPCDEVYAQLAAQQHRRFIKTHTPLDGLPDDERVRFIVTGRHPLDSAVSLYHQGQNIDRTRLRELTGAPVRTKPTGPTETNEPTTSLSDWLHLWIERDADPIEEPDSLVGVFHHLSLAWERRDEPNLLLVHYDDLLADLDAEMRRIAGHLGIEVPDPSWAELVDAATFDEMRAAYEDTVPDPSGLMKDRLAFYRRGTSGAGRELLSDDEYDAYRERISHLATPDLASWVHHEEARPCPFFSRHATYALRPGEPELPWTQDKAVESHHLPEHKTGFESRPEASRRARSPAALASDDCVRSIRCWCSPSCSRSSPS